MELSYFCKSGINIYVKVLLNWPITKILTVVNVKQIYTKGDFSQYRNSFSC